MASIVDSILNERFKVLSQIGKGGFGDVYKITDLNANKE